MATPILSSLTRGITKASVQELLRRGNVPIRWCKRSSLPILTLFTKKNEPCSLCDDAKEVLRAYSSQFVYEELYIDEPGNREWFTKYCYDIPVVHLNGQFVMKHYIDEQLLQKALYSLTTGEYAK